MLKVWVWILAVSAITKHPSVPSLFFALNCGMKRKTSRVFFTFTLNSAVTNDLLLNVGMKLTEQIHEPIFSQCIHGLSSQHSSRAHDFFLLEIVWHFFINTKFKKIFSLWVPRTPYLYCLHNGIVLFFGFVFVYVDATRQSFVNCKMCRNYVRIKLVGKLN